MVQGPVALALSLQAIHSIDHLLYGIRTLSVNLNHLSRPFTVDFISKLTTVGTNRNFWESNLYSTLCLLRYMFFVINLV